MNYNYGAYDRLANDSLDPEGNTINSGGIANTCHFVKAPFDSDNVLIVQRCVEGQAIRNLRKAEGVLCG